MQNTISEKVLSALKEVLSYASHVEDWLVVKKELLKILPPDERTSFSTRDPITKQQRMNEFEKKLSEEWMRMKQGLFNDHEQ